MDMTETLKARLAKLTTQEPFELLDWQGAIENCPRKLCNNYQDVFRDKAKELRQAGQADAAEAALALQVVSLLRIRLDNPKQPFRDATPNSVRQLPDSDDIPESLLPVLATMATKSKDGEFKARLADLCWTTQKNRHFPLVAIAIEGYVTSASALAKAIPGEKDIERLMRWEAATLRLRRALQLAKSTNHKLIGQVQSMLDSWLVAHFEEIPLLELASLLTVYQNELTYDANSMIPIAAKAAARADGEKQGSLLRRFLRLKANWQRKAAKETDAAQTEEDRAMSYLGDAEDNPSQGGKARWVAKALTALQNTNPKSPQVARLKNLMDDHQRKSIEEMETIAYPVEPLIDLQTVVQHVSGRPLLEALIQLVTLAPPMGPNPIRELVLKRASGDPFLAMASQDLVDWDGRIIAKRGSLISNDAEAAEEALRAEVFRCAVDAQHSFALGTIQPARQLILSEHLVTLADMSQALFDSPFIPPGRDYFFVRGLLEGLNGDFLIAAHLLIPQIEHALRYHLERAGEDVTTISSGVQEPMDINRLFGLRCAALEKVLGPDQVFELEGLLIRRYGSNLRNSFAHGLFWPDQFYHGATIYFWWVVLRLCLCHHPITGEKGSRQKGVGHN